MNLINLVIISIIMIIIYPIIVTISSVIIIIILGNPFINYLMIAIYFISINILIIINYLILDQLFDLIFLFNLTIHLFHMRSKILIEIIKLQFTLIIRHCQNFHLVN
jgi:hypothetical protein